MRPLPFQRPWSITFRRLRDSALNAPSWWIGLRCLGAGADRPVMSPEEEVSFEQALVPCNRIDPDALIELAQSELGLSPPSTALCELSWAIAAHCAARGHPGKWQLIEVPSFLEELERAYKSDDLLGLLDMWILLTGWMPAVGLLEEGVRRDYAEQTRAWMLERARLGRACAELVSRLL